jgi:hypothetical protein
MTVPAEYTRISLSQFNSNQWGISVNWACRCGVGPLNTAAVIREFQLWLLERSRNGKAPTREVYLHR